MKKHLKIAAAALVLAVIASTSFALDISETSDMTSVITEAETEISALGTVLLTQNIGLVGQAGGDVNTAFINQSGTGNFAAITQDSTASANMAAIIQTGTNNRAWINQK
jgi:hypothetical protein